MKWKDPWSSPSTQEEPPCPDFFHAFLLARGLGDLTIQNLASKVELVSREKGEAVYPQKRGAMVTIMNKEGRSASTEVDLAKGEPENPASWDEIMQKFVTN